MTKPTSFLGGCELEDEIGLSGHSDADVLLHALTDALLGTVGAGDIGEHFPPSDQRWKDADSVEFSEARIEPSCPSRRSNRAC